MKPGFTKSRPSARGANIALALGLLHALVPPGSARAELATPEQRRAARRSRPLKFLICNLMEMAERAAMSPEHQTRWRSCEQENVLR